MTAAAIDALRAAASKLSWPAYSALLHQWLRLLSTRETSKPVVRAVCAVLDAFHFPLPEDAGGADAEAEAAAAAEAAAEGGEDEAGGQAGPDPSGEVGAKGEAEEDDDEEDEEQQQQEEEPADYLAGEAGEAPRPAAAASDPAALAREQRDALAAEAQRVLLKRVLPALHGALVEKEWESVRPPVAIAIVKLLKVRLAAPWIFSSGLLLCK